MLLYNSAICRDVNSTFFASIAVTGFAVAFLHAALPTHWLPFVLVGRAQKWSAGRTLGVTLLAGLGHVGLTIAAGPGPGGRGPGAAAPLGGLFHWVVGGADGRRGPLLYSAGAPQPREAERAGAATPPTARRSSPWSPC
jgi:hypothetical protein